MFKLQSNYKPTGDQPQAIDYLVKGINEGKKYQTLLGVTGSRKNFYNGKYNKQSSEANLSASPQQNVGTASYFLNSKSSSLRTMLNILFHSIRFTQIWC